MIHQHYLNLSNEQLMNKEQLRELERLKWYELVKELEQLKADMDMRNKNEPVRRLLVESPRGQLPEYFPRYEEDPVELHWDRHSILGKTGTDSLSAISCVAGDDVVSCSNGNIDCSSFSFMVWNAGRNDANFVCKNNLHRAISETSIC